MSESWIVQPETTRIALSGEAWIVVKARLNAGEYRAHLRRSSVLNANGTRQIDALELSPSRVVAYLLDWSADPPIRGVECDVLISTLDAIDKDRFAEVSVAIEAHEAAQKKRTAIPSGADPTSPSPSALAGPSDKSASST